MKRQTRHATYEVLNNSYNDDKAVQMDRLARPLPSRFESTIEAKVQDGDTLQALALRFHCSVAEIKRLNKIDKDNEIFARKIIKVPITPHSVLLETLPTVHKSGQSSPKHNNEKPYKITDPLETDNFKEKLLVASVNATNIEKVENKTNSINDIILNSKIKSNQYTDDHGGGEPSAIALLSGEIDDSIPHPRSIPVPSKTVFDCSGSDCDISWICLFICILALCFAIPLIYVFYIAEHLEKFNSH